MLHRVSCVVPKVSAKFFIYELYAVKKYQNDCERKQKLNRNPPKLTQTSTCM